MKNLSQSVDFIIDRSLFLQPLSILQSVAEKRSINAVLANIKIKAVGNVLSLTATDLDITFIEKLPASILKEGEITVSAHKLYEIIKKLPEDSEVKVSSDDEKLSTVNISSGYCKFKLSCLPVEEFPVLEDGEMQYSFEIDPQDLLKLFGKTLFAVSLEETRYYLNGVFLHILNKEGNTFLVSVATDGHRLAKAEIQLSGAIEENMSGVIVPRKTIYEIKKIISNATDTIEVSISATKIRFIHNDTILISKLIDGEFPDYEKVIPQTNALELKVNSKYLAQAVDRVSTLSSEKTKAIKFSISKNKLTLFATNEENSCAEEHLEVICSEEGVNIEAGFNSRYILDMLSVFEGQDALFKFSSENNTSPVMVFDGDNQSYFFVIMPMRV